MAKTLVLAEKPSVGRDLALVLKCNQNKGSYIEGDNYVVTWALGHLVGLQDPEEYDDKYKQWSMDTLPMLPEPMELVVLKKTAKQYHEVKKQLFRNDINEIVIATDAGREGELVGRWILEKAGVKKPVKRLWISSQTDKAIKDGFNNLKPGADYHNLYKAAVCRAEADWIVGLNVTRALTCKYNAQLSAGRVQSPTLAMIVQREDEIRNFVPEDFYTITVKSKDFSMQWTDKNGNRRTFNQDFANNVLARIKGSDANIVDLNESIKKKYAPNLYDLTELQRNANRIWGYSAKQTLSIMQRLYENHKILTYPRTDSKYISTDVVQTIPERLKAIAIGDYRVFALDILKKGVKSNKSFVDDLKVSDHHAIIPTEESPKLINLNTEERNIYDLVVRRFLSVMLPPFEYIQTNIIAEINGEKFIANGKVVKSKGWKGVYDLDDEDENEDDIREQILPKLSKGDTIKINSVAVDNGKTKPPSRFNEGTLLLAMENPHKYIKVDSASAKTLGETGGLGTVATRADIIEKLFNSFVIEKQGKEIIPTSKGRQLIELVPKDLKSPLLTANWENHLENISKGKLDDKKFIDDMKKYTKELISDVKGTDSKFVHDNITGVKCPECGKKMLEVKSKTGVMYVCQDRECGHRETISRTTNARCPECKKKLVIKGNGEGKIYVCSGESCNFKEKASVFEQRFKDNKKADKREVNNYMQKMKKQAEEELSKENPFAALGDLFKK